MSDAKMSESLKGMGWGYYAVYPEHRTARMTRDGHHKANSIPPATLASVYRRTGLDYLLVGCEPETMFPPGKEPPGFRWWWWDNSMMPHLRYVNAANPTGSKWWSRITYCGWSMPRGTRAVQGHRTRINTRLAELSEGKIEQIEDIWGGCTDTRTPQRRHALICASSERNHRIFYGELRDAWIQRMQAALKKHGYTSEVRTKVGVNARKRNQVTDQLERGKFDLLVANHSACASEGAIYGVPVVLTSEWNGAWEVATPFEHFDRTGEVKTYTAQQIDTWVTRICAYTYHREELMSNEWIQLHPEAGHLRK